MYLGENINVRKRKAAIKILDKQLLSTARVQEFENEAAVIAGLHHPYIIGLLDYGIYHSPTVTASSIPFIVMDYAPGGSLLKVHKK